MFSAGYDIGGLPPDTFAQQAEALVAHPFTEAIEALEACPVPRWPSCPATPSAATGVQRFLRTLGEPRTRELFVLGRNVSSQTALSWGLVNRVVAGAALERAGLELAVELAANAPRSVRGNKHILRALIDAGSSLDSNVERELIALREACFHGVDLREGVRALDEKRRPRWSGR